MQECFVNSETRCILDIIMLIVVWTLKERPRPSLSLGCAMEGTDPGQEEQFEQRLEKGREKQAVMELCCFSSSPVCGSRADAVSSWSPGPETPAKGPGLGADTIHAMSAPSEGPDVPRASQSCLIPSNISSL